MELDVKPSKKKKECSREFIGLLVNEETIKIVDLINCGSFGDIYLGEDVKTGEYWAVKFNSREAKRNIDNLLKEYSVMKKIEGKGNFPKCVIEYSNKNKARETVLIMEHLGPNLYELFKICNKSLSPATVAWTAARIIKDLQAMHNCGIVHRDIKPENFCLGGPNLDKVYMIDFGLSKEFVMDDGSIQTLSHSNGFVGTPRYASRNSHLGVSQSRRDDLEALGYMCIFLLKGSLPWQSIKIKDKKLKHKELNLQKGSIQLSLLCAGLPEIFQKYIELTRKLTYEEDPPYDLLIQTFESAACPLDALDWQPFSEVGISHA